MEGTTRIGMYIVGSRAGEQRIEPLPAGDYAVVLEVMDARVTISEDGEVSGDTAALEQAAVALLASGPDNEWCARGILGLVRSLRHARVN